MDKFEIGIMTAQEIKDMGIYGRGLDYWTDEKIEKTQKEARKYVEKILKEEPHLYKKKQDG